MRQKRIFMILALIVGILALSMAYAAIAAQTLNVNGNVTAATSDANFDVRFTGDVTSTGDGTVTGYIDTQKDPAGRTAELSISGLKVEGQKATGCINIINNSEGIKAVLTISSIIHENPTWYKITTELGETTYIDSGTGKPVLIPGETVPLYVTVELLKTPKNDEEAALAIDTATIKVNADAIDADAELGDYGTGGGASGGNDNGASVFTINGYSIENGGYNGTSDGCYAYAQLDCKEEDLTNYNGTLHIWPSSSSEESATTYDMEVEQNVIPYVVQTSEALTLEAGTEYTYYMTFTNGTNTITTPMRTYTKGGDTGGDSGTLTVDSYELKYGYTMDYDEEVFMCFATILDTDGNGTAPKGTLTLYFWPSSSSEANASTANFSFSGGAEDSGWYYNTAKLTMEEGIEYKYYVTFTNGTDTITTPTKTYTP